MKKIKRKPARLDYKTKKLLIEQREKFIEKFGYHPGPDDPVFFDPYCDTPQPMGTSEQSKAEMSQ